MSSKPATIANRNEESQTSPQAQHVLWNTPAAIDEGGTSCLAAFSARTLTDLDTFAIPEANDPAFASDFGSLSVHEVATDKTDASRAYLSYCQGGIRSLQIQCSNPADRSTCRLVEVGGYLDPRGNNFWGIETFTRGASTYVAGSDMDSGLWIMKRTP